MAVLEKIRSRATLLVGIIGFALFAFVIGDFLNSGSTFFRGRNMQVGEINGNTISGEEFQRLLGEAEDRYKKNQNATGIDDNTRQQLINQIWNDYLDKYLFDEQMEKAGVAVSPDELFDMVQGDNINSQVQNIPIFQDSTTKKFDRNLVIKFLKTQLSEENDPDGKYRDSWAEFEKQLMKQRVKSKYNTLIKKAVYVTNAQAKRDFADKNKNFQYRLVAKKFDTIADSTIKVTDDDLKKYYDAHRFEFEQNEETRKVEYLVFQVNPSNEDRNALMENIVKLKTEFQAATNDTAFVNANSADPFSASTIKRGKLGPQIDSAVFAGSPGSVYGPYTEGEQLKLVKVLAFKSSPDSVKARHILISTQNGLDPAKALAKADSLKNAVKAGSDFTLLALQFSEDPGSKVKGGDLGYFAEGMMVPTFNDACFNGKIGDLVTVTSQFGAHLINITDQKNFANKASVSYLTKKIEPSSATIDKIYAEASHFAVNAPDFTAMKKLADTKKLFLVKYENLRPNDRQINDLTNSREIVQWVYNDDTELNAVSKVFDIDGKFVVAALTGIKDKGIPTFDQMKETLEPLAKKEKKSEQFTKEFNTALASSKTIDDLATKLKLTAEPQVGVQFSSYSIQNHGSEPKLLGTICSMKLNKISKPIAGSNGVYVVIVESTNDLAEAPKDFKQQKQQIASQVQGRVDNSVYTAILKKGNVEDKRYRFF
jgi:peptidyl-prolyl cis-trans isomerase D